MDFKEWHKLEESKIQNAIQTALELIGTYVSTQLPITHSVYIQHLATIISHRLHISIKLAEIIVRCYFKNPQACDYLCQRG